MKQTLLRLLAVFGYTSLSVVVGAAITGIDPLKTAVLAGIVSTAHIVQNLALAYAKDGKLDKQEIEQAFGTTEA